IRRSPYQALAAVSMTGLTVFVVSLFALVSLASQLILTSFETKPQVIAYLADEHKPEEVNQLIGDLTTTGLVKQAIYVSKDEALKIYKESVGNDPLLLGTVTDLGIITADVLPASVEITAKSPDNFPTLVSILERSKIVSSTPNGKKEIDFPQDVISELTAWTRAIRTAGLILASILSFNSVITIMIIISMKIASRRYEIGTMKLLGAKGAFIIKPYLIESILYGAIGGVIGWLASYIALLYSTPFLAARLTGIIPLPVSPVVMLALLAVLVVSFSLLGLFSGLLAAVRFLKR
ncbi:MAG: permease-like cell division protein FtsX, partial [Patescibacteria group bacterium]